MIRPDRPKAEAMFTVLIRLLAIFLMILAGVFARRKGLLDGSTTLMLGRLVTNILYPALIFSSLTTAFTFRELLANWLLPAGSLIIMSVGFLVGALALLCVPRENRAERRAFHFQCTINNYIFLPLPLVLIYWGNNGVAQLVFSTVGSEIAVWTLGIAALTGARLKIDTLRHLLNVPMLAVIAALAALLLADRLPEAVHASPVLRETVTAVLEAVGLFGKGTVPLAMMVAGSRMTELRGEHLLRLRLFVLAGCRLIIIPFCALCLLHFLPLPDMAKQVLMVVAIMPSSIASVMLSDLYAADTEFAASSVLLTHVCALVSIPAWMPVIL